MTLTPERFAAVRELFEAALAEPPERREAFLAGLSSDSALVAEALELLAAHDATSGTFSRPVADHLGRSTGQAGPSLVGQTLGAYRVTEEIGHGGMGTVYGAVRADDQFTKRVAIKTLRGGSANLDLLEQFRREREIQAALAHPNIAMLLDSGLTEDRTPYIVLEHVDGLPIDAYCDAKALDLRARLDLFRQVVQAVQHAHQRLVVHRDLKPSNILVTGEGVVKLLDFGISKLLDASTDHTATAGPRAFTTAYASPEQIRGEAVSTGTDVYSLGVVLFRLLTGRNPFDIEASTPTAAWATICEEPPPLPSSVATDQAAPAMGFETARRLRQALRGELDAIVLMALRKEPERRYPSVGALGEDIQHYLRGLPVVARPDSAGYRIRKLVGRNRLATAALAVAILAMGVGTVVSLSQARAAREQAAIADAERRTAQGVSEFLQEIFASADPSWAGRGLGVDATIGEAIDLAAARIGTDLADQPEVAEALHRQMVSIYTALRRPDEGKAHARRALEMQQARRAPGTTIARSLHDLGLFHRLAGALDSAATYLDESYRLFEEAGLPEVEDLAFTLNELAMIAWERGDPKGAAAHLTRAVEITEKTGSDNLILAIANSNLGVMREAMGDIDGAEAAFRRAEELGSAPDTPENYERATNLNNLAMNLMTRGRPEEAEVKMLEALAVWQRALGPDHLSLGIGKFNLARIQVALGRPAEALETIREGTAMLRDLPPDHPDRARGEIQQAAALLALGRLPEAERHARHALMVRRGAFPPTDGRVAEIEAILGRVLTARGNLPEARALLARSAESFRASLGADHPKTRDTELALRATEPPGP